MICSETASNTWLFLWEGPKNFELRLTPEGIQVKEKGDFGHHEDTN